MPHKFPAQATIIHSSTQSKRTTQTAASASTSRGVIAGCFLLIAFLVVLGILPGSWLLSGAAGAILIAAWSAGVVAFVSAVSPRIGVVSQAVAFHDVQTLERRERLKRAA